MTEANTTTHSLPLEALHLPPAPSFWPLPWGWWSLLLAVSFAIIMLVLLLKWRKSRLRAKKAALALLTLEKSAITPSGAMEIVRQAVLSYYPRNRVAHLSGESWLSFLDSQVNKPIFKPHSSDWLTALYQKESDVNQAHLVTQCETWLNDALPPRRGGRG